MLTFLRKIRKSLIESRSFRKYLLYALGEIALVVLGILIALQVNNYRSIQADKSYLKNVYAQIKEDLSRDSLIVSSILDTQVETEKRIQDILDRKIFPSFWDTIDQSNYSECEICGSDPTKYRAFFPSENGYLLLKEIKSKDVVIKDSLSSLILNFYTENIKRIDYHISTIRRITDENIKEYQQYSWFTDWANQRFNKEFLRFIFESETYRKMLSRYRIYYRNNYIYRLNVYKNQASELIKLIEERLES